MEGRAVLSATVLSANEQRSENGKTESTLDQEMERRPNKQGRKWKGGISETREEENPSTKGSELQGTDEEAVPLSNSSKQQQSNKKGKKKNKKKGNPSKQGSISESEIAKTEDLAKPDTEPETV